MHRKTRTHTPCVSSSTSTHRCCAASLNDRVFAPRRASFVIAHKDAEIVTCDGPVLLVGRSRCGKTLFCLQRMWLQHRRYWEKAQLAGEPLLRDRSHPNQVFVTLSPTFAKQVHGLFTGHILASGLATGPVFAAGPVRAANGRHGEGEVPLGFLGGSHVPLETQCG